MGVMNTARMLLESLVKSAHVEYRHPWAAASDLIWDHGVRDINGWSITVPLPDGSRKFKFDGGMTEEHFEYFAPHMDNWHKTLLAEKVLEIRFRCANYQEWDTAW